jgi:hypothetical protein
LKPLNTDPLCRADERRGLRRLAERVVDAVVELDLEHASAERRAGLWPPSVGPDIPCSASSGMVLVFIKAS